MLFLGIMADSGSELDFGFKKFFQRYEFWEIFPLFWYWVFWWVFVLSGKWVVEQGTSITNPCRSSNSEIWQMFSPLFILQFRSCFHFSHIIPNSLNSLVETYNITFTCQSQGSEWMECLQVFFSNSLFLPPRCLFPLITHLSSVSPLDVTIVFSDKLSPKKLRFSFY